jgi:hypothetical protein
LVASVPKTKIEIFHVVKKNKFGMKQNRILQVDNVNSKVVLMDGKGELIKELPNDIINAVQMHTKDSKMLTLTFKVRATFQSNVHLGPCPVAPTAAPTVGHTATPPHLDPSYSYVCFHNTALSHCAMLNVPGPPRPPRAAASCAWSLNTFSHDSYHDSFVGLL